MTLPLTYNIRNLFVRKLSTLLTFTVVAVVVFVLAYMLSWATGIRTTMTASGWPQNILVLRPGSTAESTSIIKIDDTKKLDQTPGVALDAQGHQLISIEISVQTQLGRRGRPGQTANVAVRGIDEVAFDVHPELRLIEGRFFQQGALECIAGKSAKERYAGLNIGDEIVMGRAANRTYRVVGVFESGGSSLESEILAPRTMIADSYHRPIAISSIVLRLRDASLADAAISYIDGPAVGLEGRRETQYYADLSKKTAEIVALTSILTVLMAIGAAFAVANTMYAAVDARRREIAMLRTIGFPRRSIIAAFVVESLMICLIACAVGLIAIWAYFGFSGRPDDYLSDVTWTVLAYNDRLTPGIALTCTALAVAVGVLGAFAPAIRAARVQVITALRRA